jgi:hypothetical protein
VKELLATREKSQHSVLYDLQIQLETVRPVMVKTHFISSFKSVADYLLSSPLSYKTGRNIKRTQRTRLVNPSCTPDPRSSAKESAELCESQAADEVQRGKG